MNHDELLSELKKSRLLKCIYKYYNAETTVLMTKRRLITKVKIADNISLHTAIDAEKINNSDVVNIILINLEIEAANVIPTLPYEWIFDKNGEVIDF